EQGVGPRERLLADVDPDGHEVLVDVILDLGVLEGSVPEPVRANSADAGLVPGGDDGEERLARLLRFLLGLLEATLAPVDPELRRVLVERHVARATREEHGREGEEPCELDATTHWTSPSGQGFYIW